MKLKLVKSLDHGWLFDFMRDNHSTMPDHLLPKYPDDLQDSKTNWYKIVLNDNEIVGMTSYKAVTPTLAYIQRTIIHPDYRGRGISQLAWQRLENILKSQGFHKAYCHVFTDNFPMIFARLKLGFKFEALTRDHDEPGIDCYTFSKWFK